MLEWRDLKGVGVGPGTIFRPASSATLRNNAESAFRRQHCIPHESLAWPNAQRTASIHRRARQTCGAPISSAKPTIRTTSFESSSRTIARPFHVQPVHTANRRGRRGSRSMSASGNRFEKAASHACEGAAVVGMDALQEQMKLRRHVVANS